MNGPFHGLLGWLIAVFCASLTSGTALVLGADLQPVPSDLTPVSRALFSDPNQDGYQGWYQSSDRRFWALQSFHRGDGSAPAPRLLVGDIHGKVIGAVSGTFTMFDWGWGNLGIRRYGPIRFNDTGAWCVMAEGFDDKHQFVVNGKATAVARAKPLGWGLAQTGNAWWFAYPTNSGSPATSTLIVSGKTVVDSQYVSYPRLPDRLPSPDGKRIAVAAGKDHGYFDLIVDGAIVSREIDALIDVAWSSDSQHYAAIVKRTDRCQVLLDGKPIGTEHGDLEIEAFTLDPTGAAVAAIAIARQEIQLLWNGAVVAKAPFHRLDFPVSAQSPNGRFIAMCAHQQKLVGPWSILDTTTGMVTTAGAAGSPGQVTGGDGRFALLDDGTPILATATKEGHALFRGEKRISIGNDPQPWSHLMPSPDGRFLMAAAAGHPFPCFVNGFGVGKVGERFLRAWWSLDSQYLATVTKDRSDKEVISVNGVAIQRMDECLAAWFDGVILRYLMRRGDTVSLAAVSLDGKPLPADDATADPASAAASPRPDAKVEPLPATILGKWRIDARLTLLGALKISEDELQERLRGGLLSKDQIAAAEQSFNDKRIEIGADSLRVITGDQIAEQAYEVVDVQNGAFSLRSTNPVGSTFVMTPGTADKYQTLVVVMKDGERENVLHLRRKR